MPFLDVLTKNENSDNWIRIWIDNALLFHLFSALFDFAPRLLCAMHSCSSYLVAASASVSMQRSECVTQFKWFIKWIMNGRPSLLSFSLILRVCNCAVKEKKSMKRIQRWKKPTKKKEKWEREIVKRVQTALALNNCIQCASDIIDSNKIVFVFWFRSFCVCLSLPQLSNEITMEKLRTSVCLL